MYILVSFEQNSSTAQIEEAQTNSDIFKDFKHQWDAGLKSAADGEDER